MNLLFNLQTYILSVIQNTNWPDMTNAFYEGVGSFLIWLSIIKLHRDKQVRGVHVLPILFFTSWGFWNIYYYHHLNQIASWIAGMNMVLANTIWVAQMFYYNWKEKQDEKISSDLTISCSD